MQRMMVRVASFYKCEWQLISPNHYTGVASYGLKVKRLVGHCLSLNVYQTFAIGVVE